MMIRLLDERERLALILVATHGGAIDAEEPATDAFSQDRGDRTDTWNLLFDKGALRQVQYDDDAFRIELNLP